MFYNISILFAYLNKKCYINCMFSWFKNKFNNLLPSDAHNGLMTAELTTIKVGTKLTVPENFVCFACYKDKTYLEMPTGTHILNAETLPELYKEQLGKRRSLRHLKIDLFFVNLNQTNISFSYNDKVPVSGKNTKLKFDVNINCSVNNAKKFSKFVLGFLATTTAYETEKLVVGFIQEFLMQQFLKVTLTSTEIPAGLVNELTQKLSSYMLKMALTLNNFNLSTQLKNNLTPQEKPTKSFSFNTSTSTTNNISSSNLFNNSSKNKENVVDQNPNEHYNNVNSTLAETQQSCARCCSVCGSKLITGAIFCHRCGNKNIE